MILVYIIAALQVLDVATTWYALEKAGLGEGNPIARWFIEKLGLIPGLLALKGSLGAVLWATNPTDLVLIFGCILYVGVVGNNAYLIYRRKK